MRPQAVMPTRKSIFVTLILALCLWAMTLLQFAVGDFSMAAQVTLMVAAYLLGDSLWAAVSSLRRTYFSWLTRPQAAQGGWP